MTRTPRNHYINAFVRWLYSCLRMNSSPAKRSNNVEFSCISIVLPTVGICLYPTKQCHSDRSSERGVPQTEQESNSGGFADSSERGPSVRSRVQAYGLSVCEHCRQYNWLYRFHLVSSHQQSRSGRLPGNRAHIHRRHLQGAERRGNDGLERF